MQGEIHFESDPLVAPGTTCVVILPLQPCGSTRTTLLSPSDMEQAPDIRKPIQEEITILIVDDIKMNRLMLNRRIKKGVAPNATIVEAETGEAALKIVESGDQNFQVIVMDQYMESAGGALLGTDAVIAMRRMGIKSMIIGCSGNDIDAAFREAGADLVWKKPMPPNADMIEQIRTGLGLHTCLYQS